MKLIAIILSALLTCGVCATAEEYVKGITGKGIRLGGGWRSLSTNSDAFEEGSSGGFMAGVFVTYNLSPKAAIQPELVYAEKGGATSNLFYSAGLESNYLELPVLFKYTLTPPRRLTPSLFVGPAVSTLLSANLFSHLFFGDEEHDIKDGLKSMDVSVVLGGDLEFESFK